MILDSEGKEIINKLKQKICPGCGNTESFQTSKMYGGYEKVSCLRCGTIVSQLKEKVESL